MPESASVRADVRDGLPNADYGDQRSADIGTLAPNRAENALESSLSAHTGTLARGHDDKPNWSRTLEKRPN